MSIINKIVDEVYVVNMDKDKERMKRIHKTLTDNSISYKRFPATVGSKVNFSQHITHKCNVYCTDSMKGCALSHRRIWEDIVYKNYAYALILEDDVTLSEDFEKQIENAIYEIPDDFDILYIGCKFICEKPSILGSVITTSLNAAPEEYSDNLYKTTGSVGTHGYIISNKCARQLLKNKIDTHLDLQIILWTQKYDLKTFSIKGLPVKATEEHKDSNISETFPTLLNTLLSKIDETGQTPLDWALSESFAKVGPFNISPLSTIVFVIALLTPTYVSYGLLIWLVIELLAAPNQFKNFVKFITMIAAAVSIRYTSIDIVYPYVKRIMRRR